MATQEHDAGCLQLLARAQSMLGQQRTVALNGLVIAGSLRVLTTGDHISIHKELSQIPWGCSR